MSGSNVETDLVTYEKITIDKHGIEAVIAKGQDIVLAMAGQMLELLKAYEAPNFVELKLHDEEAQEVIVTIQKGGGQSPADQIKLLKERVTELEEQIEDAKYEQMEQDEKNDV